jgi:hypothetical protein
MLNNDAVVFMNCSSTSVAEGVEVYPLAVEVVQIRQVEEAEAHLHLPEPAAGERPHRVAEGAVRPDHGVRAGLWGLEDLPAAQEEVVAAHRPARDHGQAEVPLRRRFVRLP